jgi:4-hydroxythreonine-4-phosphate dehydrogenase
MKPRIAITVGDYNGIGPEVAVKAIHDSGVRQICRPLLVGPVQVFAEAAQRSGIALRFVAAGPLEGEVLRSSDTSPDRDDSCPVVSDGFPKAIYVRPGVLSVRAGRAAGTALQLATGLAIRNVVDAVVTAPVSKKALHMAGFRFPGQTEMVQRLTHSAHVAMMLVSNSMRVGLVTIHIPLRQVSRTLTVTLLRDRIETIHRALKTDWRIVRPRLAVLGLNPHAGENGDIGSEEKTVIIPTLRTLRARGLDLRGPFPADAFFGRFTPGTYDAVVAMYHDQGLIPLKMNSFGTAVNVSAGLPVVRTSPDHGTAFDIAGKDRANPRSMIEAIVCAARIATNRMTLRTSKPA